MISFNIMSKLFIATNIFLLGFNIFVYGQNAEQLNLKSKELLLKKDYINALPLIQKSAELGNAEAQYNYGNFYKRGIQVVKNDTLAFEWFLKAAKQGWSEAQYAVAVSYEENFFGIERDNAKAFYWISECAKQNNHECVYTLASYYERGIGVNVNSSFKWLARVGLIPEAEQWGIRERVSSTRLGISRAYKNGIEKKVVIIKKDLVKSFTWALIYNEGKKGLNVNLQEKNIIEIKELEKSLTESDKINANIQAEKMLGCKIRNFTNLYIVEPAISNPNNTYTKLSDDQITILSDRFGDGTDEWMEKIKNLYSQNKEFNTFWIEDKTGDIVISSENLQLNKTARIEYTDYNIKLLEKLW